MDYSKLRGRIIEKFSSVKAFAKAMNKNQSGIYLKLQDKVAWSREEIETACVLLEIPAEEIWRYFFNLKVEKSQL